ncbi:MAG TPA: ATP-binding protein [Acidimicrobiales bacterium]|nr:ATP-binding protein [Acidimicrobiales bacterium]
MNKKPPVSLWSVLTFAVVALLSIGGWAVIRNGVGDENDALVKTGAAQVALVLQSALQNLQTELRSLAFFTSQSGDSPTVFAQEAKPLLTSPKTSVALVETSGTTETVLMASGPGLHSGQALDPALAAAIAPATALTSTIVPVGTSSYLVVAARSTAVPRLAALTYSPLDPTRAVPNQSGPYRNFFIDLYNGSRPTAANLLATTYGPEPLPSPVSTSVVRFGALTWLIAAAPKSPPAGTYATDSPWIVLGVGLVVALALAASVEVLARRDRYSAQLVSERTAELVEAQHTVVQKERLAAVGEMAAVVGHELRNPMAAVLNNLYLARLALGAPLPPEVERHLAGAEDQVNRAARIAEGLTAYTRERQPQFSSFEFADLVSEVLASTPAPEGIAVLVDATALLVLDRVLMAQVLTNLLTNAFQAMPDGGTVTLSARADPFPVITVEDTGPGIGSESADRLFNPFFTTKQEGTGLGLAIVQRLVDAQGGTVAIADSDSVGAKVTIVFRAPEAPRRRREDGSRRRDLSGPNTSSSVRSSRPEDDLTSV